MDRLESHRLFYARRLAAVTGPTGLGGRLEAALAATPRERFLGPGPWRVFTAAGYVTTPSEDATFVYHDVPIALSEADAINNGQPALHALCLAALDVKEGETAVHVGAGTGYYTAVIARLVGSRGSVFCYELEPALAERARAALADLGHVTVEARSGASGLLPACDVLYVSAGATAPLDLWLDALRENGRLLFPLTPAAVNGRPAPGAMLLVTRAGHGRFDARFLCPAAFMPCAGARDEATAARLTAAFQRGDSREVRSLRRGTAPDATAWVLGDGWWLSTAVDAG
jgi:protein-L-isoaspartate(D-aspartate) O-methyltransferase